MARTPVTLPAATAAKFVNMQGLANYDAKIKDWVDAEIAKLPEEQYLDQTKTVIVESFAWSATTYPGSTDPSLDGKPVLVFAVTDTKTTPTVKYSFISLNKLVDVYTGNVAGDTLKGVAVSVDSNRKITAEVKLHTADVSDPDPSKHEATNLLQIASDGALYVPTPAAFDSTAITGRISTLETKVGNEADAATSTPASGLIKKVGDIETALGDGTTAGLKKDVADINTTIGVKAKAETAPGAGDAVAATGMYKYVDDAISGVSSTLVYADATDISALF